MTVRIPSRVNRALDAVARNRFPLAGGLGSTGIIAAAATQSAAVTAGVSAAICGTAFLTAAALDRRRLRESLRQAEFDKSAMAAELAERRTGNPSDPTVQLRAIGDSGEST